LGLRRRLPRPLHSEHVRPSGSDSFHHVYLDPAAYAHFARTGSFPDPTMLVLEIHQRADRGAPARQGFFEGERLAVEVAVKDSEHLEDGWAYFDFSNGKTESTPFARERCYSCHVEHGREDNVFTQFYPVLRRLKAEDD
jgi:Cytochrome P460